MLVRSVCSRARHAAAAHRHQKNHRHQRNHRLCGRAVASPAAAPVLFRPAARPATTTSSSSSCPADVHPTAIVHPSATLGAGVSVGALAVVGPGVVLGPGSRVGAHCTVQYAVVGARAVLHPGARVGQDGFGFFPSADPSSSAAPPEKKPQACGVVIGDDVEIGANSTVDRGSWRDTQIGDGTKLDNAVQVGHNVVLGKNCLVCAQVGIAGSTTVGDGVLIGGQAGLAQHLSVGDGARIAAKSGVARDVAAGQAVGGYPAVPIGTFRRNAARERQTAAVTAELNTKSTQEEDGATE